MNRKNRTEGVLELEKIQHKGQTRYSRRVSQLCMVYGWYLGKAWVDRWLRRRKVEKRAETPTLTVQQKSCHQSENILLGSSWYDTVSLLGTVWEKTSVYLTRIGCAAVVSSAQASMVQLVLNAKETMCLNAGAILSPTALTAGQEVAVVWPSAFQGHLMCAKAAGSTRFLGEVRAPWHLWVLPLWASHRLIISDCSYKTLNASSCSTDSLVQHPILSIFSVVFMFFCSLPSRWTLWWQFRLSPVWKRKDTLIFMYHVDATMLDKKQKNRREM